MVFKKSYYLRSVTVTYPFWLDIDSLPQFIAAGTASFFGAQPLLISGVTGQSKIATVTTFRDVSG